VLLPGSGCTFRDFRIFAEEEREVPDSFPEKRYTKTIDYGKIKGTLVVRNRKKGDFLTIRSDGARKSLSDYFTDQKVPQSERDSIAVVADGSEIVWVLGMRIGYRYRVTDKTERAVTLKAEKLQET
jgi:tRNA(Ile)-lysidine synthase